MTPEVTPETKRCISDFVLKCVGSEFERATFTADAMRGYGVVEAILPDGAEVRIIGLPVTVPTPDGDFVLVPGTVITLDRRDPSAKERAEEAWLKSRDN